MAAIRGDKTLAEHFDVHPNQIQNWRLRLLGQADQIFGRGGSSPEDSERKIKESHAKTGHLTTERVFLNTGWNRFTAHAAEND